MVLGLLSHSFRSGIDVKAPYGGARVEQDMVSLIVEVLSKQQSSI